MAGTFGIGPATLQSLYAPEFTAYSAGHRLTIRSAGQSAGGPPAGSTP